MNTKSKLSELIPMFKKLVLFVRRRSELEKNLFGITVFIFSFTVFDDGYKWGIVFPLALTLYIMLHTIFHGYTHKLYQKGN